MSIDRIINTSLWRNSLAAKPNDIPNDLVSLKKDELRSSFIKFRENTAQLVSRIAAHLPGLTQHEISHLDALWETASLIAGDQFPLNPIEGFVLGGAILLHDSALCFEAYDNGIEGVRETTTWKDAYTALLDSKRNILDTELKAEADFASLRHLHASQAEVLTEKKWTDPDTQQAVYLIENATLRKHLGPLIGQIAASHHWDIEKVANVLPEQVNSLSGFPRDWRIDPVKIACLLRCADAAHIDNERAPDFLHALLKRKGISFNHWQAQNRLACVDLDQSDPNQNTILFTSTRSFKESESESWWVAFDAIVLVDKEIRACNALLENKNKSSFQVKRVKGVESPELMAKFIKVDGWTPCTAEIHVGNIEKLIQNLGGEKLYGAGVDILEITIRELIQNARDAIKAREVIETCFNGKITVKILQEKEETWLIVEDNGVGMTERVLTGPFLDFGTSFWTSSLVQSEFPGLRSSKFKAVGQFGIGFYSVFMVAEEVYVTTKPWKDGSSNAHQLLFKNGLSLRPLLKKGPSENFNSAISTQIKLKLKSNVLPHNLQIEIKLNIINEVNFNVPFEDYVSAICAGLDVSVYFSNEKTETLIHHNIEDSEFDPNVWLNRISFSKYRNPNTVSNYIDTYVSRLRPIKENGKVLGLATISTEFANELRFLNIRTIGV
ncbi:ATP-binding protein [Rhodocytophaga rosea]|uniref:ATP-binding protein n=1 Tax=Rhodocytophaga rosea TaxID=2704465 RepID=A0A6C0GKT9_9BACT|nr:ATP-binding protein [Rhodocytophaga rosea]QHT68273.1 ATP-binding protein [Rhodocytophaga rosea]